MTRLSVGEKAPDFSLRDTNGKLVTLSTLKGHTVVLYFYPKDDTPGCTSEACNIRDNYGRFNKEGIVVYGISADNAESHQKFTAKYALPFPLLSDEEHVVSTKYGAWGAKKMYGRSFEGMKRTTVILDKDLRVKKVFDENDKVDVNHHSEQIFKVLRESQG
jgi:peroxiredoxin Q/BCP